MKKFSNAHPKIEKHEPKEMVMTDPLALAPVTSVKLAKYSQN